MGDTVTYQSDGDPTQQAKLIDAAISEKPDGLVVSMANPEALKSSIQRAEQAGIPVITINSGEAQSKPYGALSHIGSDETVAGRAVGTQLKAAGVRNVVCVIQEAGNVGLEQRCAGVKDTLGGTVTNLQVDNNNLPAAQTIIKTKLQSDKSIDGVVTLGAQVAQVAEGAISQAGSSAKLATFDLNADVAKGVEDGKILFAVDQQPYLQGYLAVVMLTQYKSNLNILGWRSARPDRAEPHHQGERRGSRAVGRRRHAMTAAATHVDERVAQVGVLRRLLLKPEFGALIGAIVIFVFLAVQSDVFRSTTGAANWLDVSATLGLMAVPVALLMIGGHFDLSAGVQVGTAGLATGIMTTYWGLNLYASFAVSLVLMLLIGFINGFLVTRTGLPSFIVTLGMFLGLQGLNLGVTKQVTNTVQVSNLDLVPGYHALNNILGSTVTIGGAKFPIAIAWWVGFTALASWLLLETRFGNWIFATGGDLTASKAVGVPCHRTTIALFMMTSAMAWFVGNTQIVRFTSIRAQSGIGQELYFIVAAVIGGCLLTGGYGSAVGASLGALIFGMTEVGIVNVGWNSDWFKLFVGVMLLLAVLANQFVRRLAEQTRR